jgi:hypothetical protein
MVSTIALPPKTQFSGHETFPLRQLWLRKAYIAASEEIKTDGSAKKIFAAESGIRQFGVGKNMVGSIRHWALACNVLQESSNGNLEIGPIGDALFGQNGLDPFLERPATAWLIHWQLAGLATRSTTWWWVFNRITQQPFTIDSIADAIELAVQNSRSKISRVTLRRDAEVCVRGYLPHRDGRKSDDSAEPLLADIGIISEGPSGSFQFSRGEQKALPDGIFAYALLDYWAQRDMNTGSRQNTLSFESIAHEYGSPGRVFKLDENSVGDRLINMEEVTDGALRWSDSSGVRQLSRISSESAASILPQRLLRHAYGK